MTLRQEAQRELAKRELIKRFSNERENLINFMELYFCKEKGKKFITNWHHRVIADKLEEVIEGKCTRLIINIPPGHTKTEEVTKCFPVWALGKNPSLNICATGYSTALTQTYSGEARDYYESDTFSLVFPERSKLRDDQNTKEWWSNELGGGYYATGTGGSITGRRFNIFIIDDPLKPDEAESDVKRIGVNNWYENTVLSRLYDPLKDAVIIIMQRTHENDLCGFLLEKMKNGTGEKWDTIILPAEAEVDEPPYRVKGEALDKNRYPIEALDKLKQSLGVVNYSCQYQQNPIASEAQEFHREFFKYYDGIPEGLRIFMALDPAFTKNRSSDESAIAVGGFKQDAMYLLEIVHGKFNPGELEDLLVNMIKKWAPEKCGIEAYQAQSMISFSLNNRLRSERLFRTVVENITQSGDKEAKIRRLVPLYRNGKIYHPNSLWVNDYEAQLLKFPRGSHDDMIDSVQMLYNLYELQPNVKTLYTRPKIEFDQYGRPVVL